MTDKVDNSDLENLSGFNYDKKESLSSTRKIEIYPKIICYLLLEKR